MKTIINKYKNLSFEKKTQYTLLISLILNLVFISAKILLSFRYGVIFLASAFVNIFVLLSKLQCYFGIKENSKSFEKRNLLISIFIFLAGLQYSIYNWFFVFERIKTSNYSMFIGISIATISFLEIEFAIRGLCLSRKKGHYYRDLKLINLCSALTALVLTAIALSSFASNGKMNIFNAILGGIVGIIMQLIGIYAYFSPLFSIADQSYQKYQKIEKTNIDNQEIMIKLTNRKIYSNYIFKGKINEDILEGYLIKERSPILNYNIYVKILLIILSEILVFPYAVGALVFHFKNLEIIKNLEEKLRKLGYKKVS